MNNLIKHIAFLLSALLMLTSNMFAQHDNFKEQLIGWTTVNLKDPFTAQSGVRYIPDFKSETKLTEQLMLNTNISFNLYGNALTHNLEKTETDFKIKPYRLQIGLETNQLALSAGLQKINFGSASLLRPLMWFDKIDPRDPLQLTDGVYSVLGRYYFLNNANIWFWSLYGNQDRKGWEMFVSNDKKPEVGGRVQLPVLNGEIGFTYHYREGLFKKSFADTLTAREGFCENRYAIDTKVDIGIGLWFEASVTHQNLDFTEQKYQRLTNLGADYTFGIGNGIGVVAEYFTYKKSEEVFGKGDGIEFVATSINYPINLINNLQAILYYDITNNDYYRFINFSWTYDNWVIYVMGFWNPDNYQIYQNMGNTNLFSGYGAQIMVVFNH
jgi:hypothetical protein